MTEALSAKKQLVFLSLSDEFLRQAYAKDPWLGFALACIAFETELKRIIRSWSKDAFSSAKMLTASRYRSLWRTEVLDKIAAAGKLGGASPDIDEIHKTYGLNRLLPKLPDGRSFLEAAIDNRNLLRHGRRPYPNAQKKRFEPYHRTAPCTFELLLAGRRVITAFASQFADEEKHELDPFLQKDTLQLSADEVQSRLFAFADGDPACAFVCAAILFERTITLALEKLNAAAAKPVKVINRSHGLAKYAELWKQLTKGISNTPAFHSLFDEWEKHLEFMKKYGNVLLHGGGYVDVDKGGHVDANKPDSPDYASAAMAYVRATQRIDAAMENMGLSIRTPVRRRAP